MIASTSVAHVASNNISFFPKRLVQYTTTIVIDNKFRLKIILNIYAKRIKIFLVLL